jgi:hypothetical protein
LSWGFETILLCGVRLSDPHPTPNLESQSTLFLVWVMAYDLSRMGDLTTSYANASIALRIIWPRKPIITLTLQRGVTGGARIAKTPYVVEWWALPATSSPITIALCERMNERESYDTREIMSLLQSS